MNEKPTTAKDAEMTALKALGNYLAQDSCLTPKDRQESTVDHACVGQGYVLHSHFYGPSLASLLPMPGSREGTEQMKRTCLT